MLGRPRMEDILVDLFESAFQAQHDFSGEQREWHLPRLERVAKAMILWFPKDAGAAMLRAKSPCDKE